MMGIMTFLLPDGISAEARRELERSAVTGGPDNMPTLTELLFPAGQMKAQRPNDESGYLIAPWPVDGAGLVMGATATLMERQRPYTLLTELARGKINQLRCQAADWTSGGLQISPRLQHAIRDATRAFGRAVTQSTGAAQPTTEETKQAEEALALGYRAAQQLVQTYAEQVFQVRHQHSPKLDTSLSCRLSPVGDSGTGVPPALDGDAVSFAETFNTVAIPFSWNLIEAEEGAADWTAHDALLGWAQSHNLQVTGGPLVDFSSAQLPAWLWLWERDVPSMASFLCKFVESAVRRYKGQVQRWQVCAGSNCATVLGLGEDELLGLSYRLADAARQVDPSVELSLGIAQPWGEYLATADWAHSPFIFADTLIRSGIHNLTALDIEVVMGVSPRGSYCRDLLDLSRLLDLYALLGLRLNVTLGFPAATTSDPDADPELRVAAGRWRSGFNPQTQAEWASLFVALALCKPYVQGVQWVHLSDSYPHQFPHCGLLDAKEQPRPVLDELRKLREHHLR